MLHVCTAAFSCDRPCRLLSLAPSYFSSFYEVGFRQHIMRSVFRAWTRSQALYFYLSEDAKPKEQAALVLLSTVARHSVQSARQLVHSFDFTLSALPRLGHLPGYLYKFC